MESSRFLLLLFLWMVMVESRADHLPGTWKLLVANATIASMHTVVTRFNTVVLLDRTYIGGPPQYGKTRCQVDCYSQSAVFDPTTNQIRPLTTILTDTLCSSAQFLPDGTLLHTGGNNDGMRKIRKLTPCNASSVCDWEELVGNELAENRWYATNQILPNGSVIIVGGHNATTVEFLPGGAGAVNFPFLVDTKDSQEDNLYPYVHLLPNGHLFVFANNRSILYDYINNRVLREYPQLDGGPRNYPSAGSSVMLALEDDYSTATIVVCGGAEYGAFRDRKTGTPAHGTCGRIDAMREDSVWEVEQMPFGRIMGDMVILPTGDVLIINGAQAGSQGFELASEPCLYPVLYRPDEPVGFRFMTLIPGSVPRMYHSTANLLPDGRVLVAGSNPHDVYNFSCEFPTELRIEAFSPEYLSPQKAGIRPVIVQLPEKVHYGDDFFIIVKGEVELGRVEVNIASAPYATHSFSQGQRLVKLDMLLATHSFSQGLYIFACMAPPDGRVAPPGYYMVFAVNNGVPSEAKWVQLV